MDLTEEWKSHFPIAAAPGAPLLLSSSDAAANAGESLKQHLGPLFFNPEPDSTRLLISSLSLSPPILSSFPSLSLPRFLSTSSSVPPSSSSSIAASFGSQNPRDDSVPVLSSNRLQLLPLPGNNKRSVLLFFPTGSNLDQVGFLMISGGKKGLEVKKGEIFVTKERFFGKIVRILVNPIIDDNAVLLSPESSPSVTIGYVMAFTTYYVHWYVVKLGEPGERPVLSYLGCKHFKSQGIVSACWSPHLPMECLVLLENGVLFLFDLSKKTNGYCKGNRIKVPWEDQGVSGAFNWLGCEFSWHPRSFIVAGSAAVFLIDLSSEEFIITCLAKIQTLSLYARKEQFLAFSKAGIDGLRFVLASQSLLFLCDVRRPLVPLLQWVHFIDKPCYIDIYRLSELRLQSGFGTFDWADDSGSCIILGSFWNCRFSIFCYGPPPPIDGWYARPEVLKNSLSLYAWELPSNLLLSVRECCCGDCILRDEFENDCLSGWIDWQQKKETVLGFRILNRYMSEALLDSDGSCGFTLIRLMSSGKLETQKFCASWDLVKELQGAHLESVLHFGDEENLLYLTADEEYKFSRRFKYMKLNSLTAYLNGNLTELVDSKMRRPSPDEKAVPGSPTSIFDDQDIDLGSQALDTLDVFKKHLSLWQERFTPYQEFLARHNL